MLTRDQFEMLRFLQEEESFDAGICARKTGVPEKKAHAVFGACVSDGLVDARGLTSVGIKALAPRKTHPAVILAAGSATRFAPLSFERPKAMFEVHGEVLIERLIAQLRDAGIGRIAVVVGYMKEAFFYLSDEFDVELVVNDASAGQGNHASLYAARDVLVSGAYICSSDQYYDENPFRRYEYGPTFYLDRKAATSGACAALRTRMRRRRRISWTNLRVRRMTLRCGGCIGTMSMRLLGRNSISERCVFLGACCTNSTRFAICACSITISS